MVMNNIYMYFMNEVHWQNEQLNIENHEMKWLLQGRQPSTPVALHMQEEAAGRRCRRLAAGGLPCGAEGLAGTKCEVEAVTND